MLDERDILTLQAKLIKYTSECVSSNAVGYILTENKNSANWRTIVLVAMGTVNGCKGVVDFQICRHLFT